MDWGPNEQAGGLMPIRPENRHRYPLEWQTIRAGILVRAENRCERCRVPNHAVGYRDSDGTFVPLAGNGPCDAAGRGEQWPGLDALSYGKAREFADLYNSHNGGRDEDGH